MECHKCGSHKVEGIVNGQYVCFKHMKEYLARVIGTDLKP